MKLFERFFGKKYLEWDEYKKRINDMEDKYYEVQSQKRAAK